MNALTQPRLNPDCFYPPVHDEQFVRLSDELRDLVGQRLSAMRTIAYARKISEGVREVKNRHHGRRGWGQGTLMELWYKFSNAGGDWKILLDKARAGVKYQKHLESRGLPDKFIEHLGEIWAPNQRDKFKPGWDKLKTKYHAWRRGDQSSRVPGYLTCPEPEPTTGLPKGWTYENLKRAANKAHMDYSRKLIQIGSKAAAELSVPILTTRASVEVGQVYFFDDSWNDFKVLFRGQATRVLSFHCLDLRSGCNIMRGYKPAFEDEQGTEERLKEREMVYLAVTMLTTVGYHPDGCTFAGEKATATLRKRERDLLEEITGGKVIFKDGPAGGGSGIAGLFNDRSGGNPRWKAPLESWFNLLRNRTANVLDFPGQTGSNARLNGPQGLEEIAGTDKAVMRAMQVLPPDKAELLRFNLLFYHDAVPALDAITEVINTRDDHKLEGWRRCGHYVPAIRSAAHLPWMPANVLLNLPPAEQEQWRLKLLSDPQLAGETCLSPRQVFDAGRAKLKRFTPAQAALLLAETSGNECNVEKGLLRVNCPEVDLDEPLHYGPILRDLAGSEVALRNNDKWLVRVNPLMPKVAFIYDAKGGFVGLTEVYDRAGRTDETALQEQFKVKQQAVSEWTRDARKMAAPITQRAVDIATHNARIVSGKPLTLGEKRAAKRTKELKEMGDRLLAGK